MGLVESTDVARRNAVPTRGNHPGRPVSTHVGSAEAPQNRNHRPSPSPSLRYAHIASSISGDGSRTPDSRLDPWDSRVGAAHGLSTSSSGAGRRTADALFRCRYCHNVVRAADRTDHYLAHELQVADERFGGLVNMSPPQLNRTIRFSSGPGSFMSFGFGSDFDSFGDPISSFFEFDGFPRGFDSFPAQDQFSSLPEALEYMALAFFGSWPGFGTRPGPPPPPQGTPDEIINSFPIQNQASQSNRTPDGQSSSEETCLVCLEEKHPADNVRRLPCMHAFHVACIDRWLKQSVLCPVCKAPVDRRLTPSGGAVA